MRTPILVALLSLSASCSTTPDLSLEADAVRALWDETNAALAAKDWDRYQAVWLHEPALQVVHPAQGDWINGWQDFSARYQNLFASPNEFSVESSRFNVDVAPSAEMAWATIEATLSVNGIPSTHWYVIVTEKIDGRWRIAVALDSPPPASTAAGA
jgi:ketosteroid isomerase-like protein